VDKRFVPGESSEGNGESLKSPQLFETLGEQLQAVVWAGTPGHTIDPRLLAINRATGLSEGLAADGGFLVQADFIAEIYRRAYEIGAITSRCRRIPISAASNSVKINALAETSRATGSRWGGIQGYWLSEAGTKTASRPTFRQMELALKKLAVLVYATDELLQDAAALEAVVSEGAAEEISFLAEDAIVNGTGAGQPLGVLNAPALVTVAKEAGQAAATIVSQNILKMWSRMWGRSRPDSIWLVNQDVEPQLYQFSLAVGVGGQVVYMPPGGLSATPYATLMGRPVIPVEYCQTLGTVGDILLADFREYLLAEKGGIEAAMSIHVNFIYDETAFRFVFRVDGQPGWNAALTPFKGTNTLSPFVVLATRA
jgi:HK97 family phage major capsid protein